MDITQKELEIMHAIRQDKYDAITIIFNNGDISRIETKTHHIAEDEKLIDMIQKVSHGNFTIKKKDGKIVFIEKTEKRKF